MKVQILATSAFLCFRVPCSTAKILNKTESLEPLVPIQIAEVSTNEKGINCAMHPVQLLFSEIVTVVHKCVNSVNTVEIYFFTQRHKAKRRKIQGQSSLSFLHHFGVYYLDVSIISYFLYSYSNTDSFMDNVADQIQQISSCLLSASQLTLLLCGTELVQMLQMESCLKFGNIISCQNSNMSLFRFTSKEKAQAGIMTGQHLPQIAAPSILASDTIFSHFIHCI